MDVERQLRSIAELPVVISSSTSFGYSKDRRQTLAFSI
jgi:hypothetical protein